MFDETLIEGLRNEMLVEETAWSTARVMPYHSHVIDKLRSEFLDSYLNETDSLWNVWVRRHSTETREFIQRIVDEVFHQKVPKIVSVLHFMQMYDFFLTILLSPPDWYVEYSWDVTIPSTLGEVEIIRWIVQIPAETFGFRDIHHDISSSPYYTMDQVGGRFVGRWEHLWLNPLQKAQVDGMRDEIVSTFQRYGIE